ncbi:MAG: carboxypeptidase regulatory-like domain-containing protein, partial [Gammaproteobacteria bacterium]
MQRLLFIVLIFCSFAAAQEYRGTILGRVTDPSGSAVPGAKVTAINEGTNVASSAQSTADGAYVIPFLIPGKYRVEAEASGFRKYVQSGITVRVNAQVTVAIPMQVGAVAESITVTADAPLLESSTATMGQVIDRKKVEAMPLNGRMIFILNRLAQGVIWQTPTFGATGTSGLRPFDNLGGSAWSMNGGRLTTNEFQLDGAPNSTRGRYNFAPPVDAVEEFKVQTNSFDAQYGRTGGGVVNMTLKSGTNQLHGQLWNFTKYGAWNANNSLNVAQGRAKPPHQYNQDGFTVGGPVRVPKIYNGQDRTFW